MRALALLALAAPPALASLHGARDMVLHERRDAGAPAAFRALGPAPPADELTLFVGLAPRDIPGLEARVRLDLRA
jgi:hypothetical protein